MPVFTTIDCGNTITVHLAGTLSAACVADIERALEHGRQLRKGIVLDLAKVRLIDRPTTQYLVDVQSGGARLMNCSVDVMECIQREGVRRIVGG